MNLLPSADRRYLVERGIAFDEIEDSAGKGIILRRQSLPAGRFDTITADILVVLPPGYPDVAPDMFFLMPWVRLVASRSYPRAADVPFAFAKQTWQRWSRHNPEWRAGVDGIWTMLKRIEHALEIAA